MILATTGHREMADVWRSAALHHFEAALRHEVSEVRFGGALGWDTDALRLAAYERTLRPLLRYRLVIVVPDTVATQPKNAREWFHLADEVVELRLGHRTHSYHQRNRALVSGWGDRPGAHRLLAAWDQRERGGTYETVRYARSRGVAVDVLGEAF